VTDKSDKEVNVKMDKKIGFIGCGNMGGALAIAAANSVGASNIYVSDADNEKAKDFADKNSVNVITVKEVAEKCDVIFLGVKPQVLKSVCSELAPIFKARKDHFVIVSMAAGVKLCDLEEMCEGDFPIIRIMPNIPASVGAGMILYTGNKNVTDEDFSEFTKSLEKAGMLDKIEEAKIDAASAISGCGPAFVFMFIEALADGGVKCGLPREKALLYAAETLFGSAKMVLETNEHPGKLKDAVCSPAGSTIEGVNALENGSFRADVMNAVDKAYKRTVELGK
jgi:pyrroline-5-carboxylate reductase